MTKNDWDLEAANATYNVEGWGTGYFSINADGNVVAKPLQENGGAIPILEVINEALCPGSPFPLSIRFQDLPRHPAESVTPLFQNPIPQLITPEQNPAL